MHEAAVDDHPVDHPRDIGIEPVVLEAAIDRREDIRRLGAHDPRRRATPTAMATDTRTAIIFCRMGSPARASYPPAFSSAEASIRSQDSMPMNSTTAIGTNGAS